MSNDRQEKIRNAYQMVVDFLRSEEKGIWARFNVMLVANSIIITAISLGITNDKNQPILTIYLPIFGFFLCCLWFCLINRSYGYRNLYVLEARELEARLPNYHKILSHGKKFADGDNVDFHILGESQPKMSIDWLSSEKIAYGVIISFAILYLLIFLNQSLLCNIHLLRKLPIIHILCRLDNYFTNNCV